VLSSRVLMGVAEMAMTDRPVVISSLRRWLMEGLQADRRQIEHGPDKKYPWWRVMCLTGVDYLSHRRAPRGRAVAGRDPAADRAHPVRRAAGVPAGGVAEESPHGQGSIAILERLAPQWWGKLFVLALLASRPPTSSSR
jgi:hypothetical protein